MTRITGWFPPRCPECMAGKCGSCAGFTLNDADEFIDCECTHTRPEGTA